jgi:hypothetical protein
MKDLTKLRKLSDDLYVEDFEGKDGAKRQFKYEREFEVAFSSEVDLKEAQWDGRKLFSTTDEDALDTRTDKVGSTATITARGGEFNGSITVLDHDKPLTLRRASSVTISRLPQWEEVLERFRSKGPKMFGGGRTVIFTSSAAEKGYGSADELNLELYLPPEQFDYIVSAISATGPARLKLSAVVKISAFRSEVDKALSEPWHPRHIWIESNTPAILYRLTAASKLTAPEPTESIGNRKSAAEIWLPCLFWLGLAILAAVILRL